MRLSVTLALVVNLLGAGVFDPSETRTQPAAANPAAADEAAFVARLNKLWEQYNTAYFQDDLAAADRTNREILSLTRQRYGNRHETVAAALDMQALLQVHLGDSAASKKAAAEQQAIVAALYGGEEWRIRFTKARERMFLKLAELSAEDRKRIRDTNRNGSEAQQLVNQGQNAKALALYESVLATRRQLMGDEQLVVAYTLRNLGICAVSAGAPEKAEAALRESLKLFERLLQKEHPEVAYSRCQLAWALRKAERYVEAEALILEAVEIRKRLHGPAHEWTLETMDVLADLYDDMDADEKALTLRGQQLELKRQALGEEHLSTVQTMLNLGGSHDALGQYQKATELYSRSLAIRQKLLGAEHEDTLSTMETLATHYDGLAQFAKAEPLRAQLLAISRKVHGEEHPVTATRLHESAATLNNAGNRALALEQVSKAAEVRQKLLGNAAPETLTSQRLLASVYGNMGQNAAQERLLVACLAEYRKLHGENHLETANTLRELGVLYLTRKEYIKADVALTKSLAIVRKLETEPAGDTVIGLWVLGGNYVMLGKYGLAEKTILEAIEHCRAWLGPDHSLLGMLDVFLATTYQLQGKLPEAEAIHRRSLAAAERMLGKDHPLVTRYRAFLATVLYQRGKYDEAFAELRIVLSNAEREFHDLGSVVSDDESIAIAAAFGGFIQAAVEFAANNERFVDETYSYVVRFKGQVMARQRLLRAVADSPEIQGQWRELEQTAAELASHSRRQPTPDDAAAWQARLEQLASQMTRLTTQISQSSAKYRVAREPITASAIQSALPADAVLVDFAECSSTEFPKPGEEKPFTAESHLAAFIVRRGQPTRLVDLGPAEPLQEAIDVWRSDFGGKSAAGVKAANFLREKIWLPIEKHLEGAKLVLVSPEGELARLPLGALPGKAPGSYLMEDWTITLIPSAQAIPDLLRDDQAAVRTEGNLLLVGGVDYQTRPGTKHTEAPRAFKDFQSFAARGSGKLEFAPLAGAKDEVVVIERSYVDLIDRARRGMTMLEGAGASEEEFRRLAPRHAYLHVATHGFFAPPEIKSALDRPATAQTELLGEFVTKQSIAGYHPGLLSGLALAGASNPSAEGDDGILTAQEVSTLDLRGVKLVVLSACETGLGEVAGGEGLLGLQRSFQAAGARSVVATLWKVDDLVTRDLMKRFYDNLWNKGLSKIESLREAQLWLLKERGPRGLAEVDEATKATNRLPPFYWAAFTLSGDWR